jgi:hypothetical protein
VSVRAWSFLRPQPGELRPLAQTAVDAFFFHGGRLPRDEDGFVRYVEVIVLLENRRVVDVLRISFIQHRALADGTLDRGHIQEVMAAAGEVVLGNVTLSKPAPGIIGAEHRFARRRLEHMGQWKPRPDEQAKLRDLVNHRARRKVL